MDVDRDVVHRAKAGQLGVGPPSAELRGPRTGINLDGQHLANVSAGDDLPGLLETDVVASLEVQADLDASRSAGVEDPLGDHGIGCERLVAEHVLPGLRCGNRLVGVKGIRGRDGETTSTAGSASMAA